MHFGDIPTARNVFAGNSFCSFHVDQNVVNEANLYLTTCQILPPLNAEIILLLTMVVALRLVPAQPDKSKLF